MLHATYSCVGAREGKSRDKPPSKVKNNVITMITR
jgi:hypothetical protein